MKIVRQLFQLLTEGGERHQRKLDDAYLAEATDIYDLECRMAEIERRNRRARNSFRIGFDSPGV